MQISAFGAAPQLALVGAEGDDDIQAKVDAWVDQELAPLVPAAARLICIDGLDGVGKSTIARSFARQSGANLVEVDSYLQRNRGQYLSALDLISLERDLRAEIRVIAEGCLIRAVLTEVNLKADFGIYVVRTTKMHGHPDTERIDEHELLFGSMTAEEIIAREEEQLRCWAEVAPEFISASAAKLPGLTKELIAYHREFLPHKCADLILRTVRIT